MHRLLCLCLVFGQLFFASCTVASAGSWIPLDGPYSVEAARSIHDWIDSNIASDLELSSVQSGDLQILHNLVTGTLIWAYSYGSTFDSNDFLLHFSQKDESVQLLPLQDGGLVFVLETVCLKISRDKISPQDRIFPENQIHLYPRNRWFASIFNDQAEITFYFSAMGPFSFPPEAPVLSDIENGEPSLPPKTRFLGHL